MFSQWIGIGNVGKDAEQRFLPSGVPVTTFSLAISKTWTKDGQKQERTTWHEITCWNKLAEVCAQYVTKGMKVMVVGEVEESKPYTDKDGNLRATIKITAQTVKFLSGNKAGENATSDSTVEADVPF